MKKLISILLTLVMTMSVFAVTSIAATPIPYCIDFSEFTANEAIVATKQITSIPAGFTCVSDGNNQYGQFINTVDGAKFAIQNKDSNNKDAMLTTFNLEFDIKLNEAIKDRISIGLGNVSGKLTGNHILTLRNTDFYVGATQFTKPLTVGKWYHISLRVHQDSPLTPNGKVGTVICKISGDDYGVYEGIYSHNGGTSAHTSQISFKQYGVGESVCYDNISLSATEEFTVDENRLAYDYESVDSEYVAKNWVFVSNGNPASVTYEKNNDNTALKIESESAIAGSGAVSYYTHVTGKAATVNAAAKYVVEFDFMREANTAVKFYIRRLTSSSYGSCYLRVFEDDHFDFADAVKRGNMYPDEPYKVSVLVDNTTSKVTATVIRMSDGTIVSQQTMDAKQTSGVGTNCVAGLEFKMDTGAPAGAFYIDNVEIYTLNGNGNIYEKGANVDTYADEGTVIVTDHMIDPSKSTVTLNGEAAKIRFEYGDSIRIIGKEVDNGVNTVAYMLFDLYGNQMSGEYSYNQNGYDITPPIIDDSEGSVDASTEGKLHSRDFGGSLIVALYTSDNKLCAINSTPIAPNGVSREYNVSIDVSEGVEYSYAKAFIWYDSLEPVFPAVTLEK